MRANGLAAVGATSEEEAAARLAHGSVTALLIGEGIEDSSQQRLRALAEQCGVKVLANHAPWRDPESYLRAEFLAALELLDAARGG